MRALARGAKRPQKDAESAGLRDTPLRGIPALRRGVLAWYDANRRDLPWRKTSDPYGIWLSEIMLQQTRVAAVVERYRVILGRFPTIASLAAAREEDLLTLWSGLGYYRRARMLHQAAKVVMAEHGGKLPLSSGELRALPGIGNYTAAAIASIAFGEPAAVVDGNVERVLCRLRGWDGGAKSNSALRSQIETLAGEMVSHDRPGDFNQAMMELGATVCLPRNPQCQVCPLSARCVTRGEHKAAPRKPMRTVETGYALALRPAKGKREHAVLLVRRSAGISVMPGMWELPALRDPAVAPTKLRMTVRHAIMQVNYVVRIQDVTVDDLAGYNIPGKGTRWVEASKLASLPLTGLARKVLIRAKLLTTLG